MIINTEYICPNITIETFNTGKRHLYIYNYKGIQFRLFDSKHTLDQFMSFETNNCIREFSCESKLDFFLKNETRLEPINNR